MIDNSEKIASIILKQLWTPSHYFMTCGQRNDDCVDFCIAMMLQGTSMEDAWDQLLAHAIIGKEQWHKDRTYDIGPWTEKDVDGCEEHFNRIWPYALKWKEMAMKFTTRELTGRLIQDYGLTWEQLSDNEAID